MSDLSQQITEDMKTAMREKNTLALNTIRMLKSAIKNTAIEKGGADAELNDTEVVGVIRKQVKTRQDSVTQYEAANRQDLADKEQAEIEVIERYLPKQLSEDEARGAIAAIIDELGLSSKKELGTVMKEIKARYPGQVDGRLASSIAGQLLG